MGIFYHSHCIPCLVGKCPQQPYLSHGHRAGPGELLHIDNCRPFSTLTPQKHSSFLEILEDHSNFGYLASFKRRAMPVISIALQKQLSNSLLGLASVLYAWMVLRSCVKAGWGSISGVKLLHFRSLHLMLIHRTVKLSIIFGLSKILCRLFLLTLVCLLLFVVGLFPPLSTFVTISPLLFCLLVLRLLKPIIVVSLISPIFVYGGVSALL